MGSALNVCQDGSTDLSHVNSFNSPNTLWGENLWPSFLQIRKLRSKRFLSKGLGSGRTGIWTTKPSSRASCSTPRLTALWLVLINISPTVAHNLYTFVWEFHHVLFCKILFWWFCPIKRDNTGSVVRYFLWIWISQTVGVRRFIIIHAFFCTPCQYGKFRN